MSKQVDVATSAPARTPVANFLWVLDLTRRLDPGHPHTRLKKVPRAQPLLSFNMPVCLVS